jgi:hypothetical protein
MQFGGNMKYSYVVFLFILAACGSGGSNGGGGGGAAVSSNPFAGSYTGIESLTTTAADLPTIEGEFPLLINILSDGAVTVTDSAETRYTGTMSGSSFTASGSQGGFTAEENPDVTCSVDGTYSGTVSDGNISGTVSGTISCNSGSITADVPYMGTFEVSSAAPAASVSRSKGAVSLTESVMRAMREGT